MADRAVVARIASVRDHLAFAHDVEPVHVSVDALRMSRSIVPSASAVITTGEMVWSSNPKAAADRTHPVMRWTIAEGACLAQECGVRRGSDGGQTGVRPWFDPRLTPV